MKKFETWFKKVDPPSKDGAVQGTPAVLTNSAASTPAAEGADGQKDVGKYIFFDFENGWQQLVRDDFELDLSQIENELVV